jgi:hypothetical protein
MRLALAIVAALFLVSLAGGGSAFAHHGWGDYDVQRRLVLEGEIVAVDYAYPHVSIELKDGDKTWHVILAPPSRMERRGIFPDDLVIGEVVQVMGYPSKTEIDEMRAESITLNDETVPMR